MATNLPENFADPSRANLGWSQSSSARYHALVNGVPVEVRRKGGQHGRWESQVGNDVKVLPSFAKAKADARRRASQRPPLDRRTLDLYWQGLKPSIEKFRQRGREAAKEARMRRKPAPMFSEQVSFFDMPPKPKKTRRGRRKVVA